MGERGGGEEKGRPFLSFSSLPFSLPSFPFSPETPDTQATSLDLWKFQVGGTEGGRQILYRRFCINQYNSPLDKLDGNWAEVTPAKTSGAATRDREKIGQ